MRGGMFMETCVFAYLTAVALTMPFLASACPVELGHTQTSSTVVESITPIDKAPRGKREVVFTVRLNSFFGAPKE